MSYVYVHMTLHKHRFHSLAVITVENVTVTTDAPNVLKQQRVLR
jgi:hypothetical protein